MFNVGVYNMNLLLWVNDWKIFHAEVIVWALTLL
jgi:hypothetical protein